MSPHSLTRSPRPGFALPAGIGLRTGHCVEFLETQPEVGFIEGHAENYFGRGGKPLYFLQRARRDHGSACTASASRSVRATRSATRTRSDCASWSIRICFHRQGLAEHFPREVGWQSLLGLPIIVSDGRILGRLAFFDSPPHGEDMLVDSIFRIVLARAAAEIERIQALARLAFNDAAKAAR